MFTQSGRKPCSVIHVWGRWLRNKTLSLKTQNKTRLVDRSAKRRVKISRPKKNYLCQVPSCSLDYVSPVLSLLLLFCVVFVYSSLLSFQTRHALPLCVCPALLIVCPALIVFTCLWSPCVYSLCVPVFSLPVRPSFFMFLAFQRLLKFIYLLVLPTPVCLTDSALAFSLLDILPDLRLPARVPTFVRTYNEPCHCLPPSGSVCLFMDCLPVYRTRSVKVVDWTYRCLLNHAIGSSTTNASITPWRHKMKYKRQDWWTEVQNVRWK